MISIAVLLATGLYNFIMITKTYDLKGTPYHAIFGVKFLLALAIFFLASVLVGRSEMAQRARQNAGKWLTILTACCLILLALSSVLKNLPHKPKVTCRRRPGRDGRRFLGRNRKERQSRIARAFES